MLIPLNLLMYKGKGSGWVIAISNPFHLFLFVFTLIKKTKNKKQKKLNEAKKGIRNSHTYPTYLFNFIFFISSNLFYF